MSFRPSFIAGISLSLLLCLIGLTTVRGLEQAGVIGCSGHVECADSSQDTSNACSHGACPHQILAVLWTPGASPSLVEAHVDHPVFTPLRHVGPVFAIDHPPQIS